MCVFSTFFSLAKKEFQVAKGENYREYPEKNGVHGAIVVRPCESTRLGA